MELVGRVLAGRYRIVRGIGAGGMGGVYEAVQEDLGRRVAVKVIAEQLAQEPVYLERFRREAVTAASLGHPNLVTVTDFQHPAGEPPFLVMEMLDGEPLNKRLSRGALEPEAAVDITLQILAGMSAAHAGGIVHRDLKPANVFLVPLPADRVLVKILDFGIAKLMDSAAYSRLTKTGVLVGTPRYAAPEQLRDSKSVDGRTDVYAIGALLYCMLSGRPPYRSSGAQLLVDITDRDPTDPRISVPVLSPGLVSVVRRAMAKAREARYGSASEFAQALAPFAGSAAKTDIPATLMPQRILAPTAPIHSPPTATPATWSPPSPAAHTPPPTPWLTPSPATQTPSAGSWHTPASNPPPASHTPRSHPPARRATPTPGPSSGAGAPSGGRSSVVAGVVLGVLAGVLLLVAVGGGMWLGWSEAHQESSPLEVTPTGATTGTEAPGNAMGGVSPGIGAVPAACREWEQIACGCESPEIVEQYCGLARGRIAQIQSGFGITEDCPRLLDAMRAACSVGAPAPPPVGARPATGIPDCDAAVRTACTCGAPGPGRDERCRRSNQQVTDVINASAVSDAWRRAACQAERSRVDRECRGT